MRIIIGLGNPGKEYTYTRHNAGFMALDYMAKTLGLPEFKTDKKFFAEISQGIVDGTKFCLIKPQTYMNDSGKAARAVMDFYKATPADITVVHDEKDLPLGVYKTQSNRGAAGHNGVKSLIEHLGTQDFKRVRIGVAGPLLQTMGDTADFVLAAFTAEEKKQLTEVLAKITSELSSHA